MNIHSCSKNRFEVSRLNGNFALMDANPVSSCGDANRRKNCSRGVKWGLNSQPIYYQACRDLEI
jgi:hypothetical protein